MDIYSPLCSPCRHHRRSGLLETHQRYHDGPLCISGIWHPLVAITDSFQ
nr:unnamed protein product [Mus musculus]